MEQKTDFYAYERFSDARDAMREVMNSYAFSENEMFDGNGGLIQLKKYADTVRGYETKSDREDDDEEDLFSETLDRLSAALCDIFTGKEHLPEDSSIYFDGLITVEYEEGEVSVFGEDDGPCNGYDPEICTNCFSMEVEKDYFLHVKDLFGQDELPAVLYIDLKKTELR